LKRILPSRAQLARLGHPRTTVILAALVIEGALLCLWPAVYLSDSSEAPSRLGSIFLVRYPWLGDVLGVLKAAVDRAFPGALWTWEHVVAFLFQSTILAFVAYAIAAWRLAGLSSLKLRWIVGPLLLFLITLVVVPASMTTDIFNYALYGEMPVLYGANPFIRTPSDFPQNPLYYLIPLYWHDAPSVYGPLWIAISVAVASVFRPLSLADELLCYRLIANAAHVANTVLVWRLARRLRPDAAPSAAIAYGWNPLLLVDFGLNGHNDALMLTLLLGAFLAASYRRVYAAAALLGLSVAAKYTTVLVAPVMLVATTVDGAGWKALLPSARARRLAIGAAIICLLPVAFYVPWLDGLGTFGPVLRWASGPVNNNYWPEPMLLSFAHWLASILAASYDSVWDATLSVVKIAAKVALVALIGFECARVRSMEDALIGSTRVFIFFLLFVTTWVMPWYYAWPLAISAPLGWGSLMVRVCAGLTLTAMIAMYQRQLGHMVVSDGSWFLVLPILLVLLAAVAPRFPWRRLGFNLPSRPAVKPDAETIAAPEAFVGVGRTGR
jgi:hypothetical protein